jgi:hypothetical protein
LVSCIVSFDSIIQGFVLVTIIMSLFHLLKSANGRLALSTLRNQPFSDALYNDASILLIASPLYASSIMLAILSRDKYIHERCVEWCEEDGEVLSKEEFKDRKEYYARFVPFSRFSPFY